MPRTYRAGLITGVALSLTALLLAPALRPVAARWGRPIAKGAIRGGLETYDTARERIARLGEQLEDLVAEAQLERMSEASLPGDLPAPADAAAPVPDAAPPGEPSRQAA